ncbi:MAG: hypothetical protein WC076_01445 [Terrimicrobiaceae bacterium]
MAGAFGTEHRGAEEFAGVARVQTAADRRSDDVVRAGQAIAGRHADSPLPHSHLVEYDIALKGHFHRSQISRCALDLVFRELTDAYPIEELSIDTIKRRQNMQLSGSKSDASFQSMDECAFAVLEARRDLGHDHISFKEAAESGDDVCFPPLFRWVVNAVFTNGFHLQEWRHFRFC